MWNGRAKNADLCGNQAGPEALCERPVGGRAWPV